MLSWHDNRIFDSHCLIYLLDLRTRSYRKKLARCLEYHYYLLKLVESYWQCVVHQVGERYGHPVAASTTSRQQSIGGPVARARLISAGVWVCHPSGRNCVLLMQKYLRAREAGPLRGQGMFCTTSMDPLHPCYRMRPLHSARARAPNPASSQRLPQRERRLRKRSPHPLRPCFGTLPPGLAVLPMNCCVYGWQGPCVQAAFSRNPHIFCPCSTVPARRSRLPVCPDSRNCGVRNQPGPYATWKGAIRDMEGSHTSFAPHCNIYRVAGQSDLRGMVAVRLSRQALIAAAVPECRP
ncbi:hypothetical protein B0H14DRAFT_2829632 [Mycena olivaceomarginata]|nr:hypothetical protein B0H14DRAFT_2829632 [Mycena olivaceomarginata]